MIREIQALRGLAVLLVVFHHLGGWIPSGFVGVDVFFVISGYVVTRSVIRRAENEGGFGFWAFLRDRFVRLAPALVFLVLMVLGFQMLTSPKFSWPEILESGLFSMGYVSNIYSQIKLGDYFGEVASSGPFLHTWSLSVEFQIYIALGLAFLFTLKASRNRASAILWLAIFSLLSFGVVVFGEFFPHTVTATEYISGYYSPLARFYEVAVGAIIALLPSRISFPRWVATVGVVIIIICSFIPDEIFGWRAIAVIGVIGSVLSILGFLAPTKQKLGVVPQGFSMTGDYSYSVYLWHWPIWVTVSSTGLNEIPAMLLSVFLTGIFSWVSNIAFERPFLRLRERSRTKVDVRQLQVLTSVPLVFMSVLGLSTVQFPPPAENAAQREGESAGVVLIGDVTERGFADDFRKVVSPCADTPNYFSPNIGKQHLCYENSSEVDLDILVLGNSHAGHLIPGLATVFPEFSFRYYPVSDGISLGNPKIIDAVSLIKRHSIDADRLLINSFWSIEDYSLSEILLIGGKLGFEPEEIMIFNDVPDFRINPERCKYKELFWLPSPCAEDLPRFAARLNAFNEDARRELPSVNLVDTAGFFRNEDNGFYLGTDSSVYYRDRNHLNSTGSVELFKHLKSRNLFF
jgi:peptidoglycan/LPS O-acetylase OafA/YrhL